MLYEFYTTQRIKNPKSINATYLLDGVPKAPKQSRTNEYQQDGEDTHILSSPYVSSSVPHQEDQAEAAPSRSIILAKEEDLEGELRSQSVGWVYFTTFEMPAAEKSVSGKGQVQANTLYTYLQLGAEYDSGELMKPYSSFDNANCHRIFKFCQTATD